MDLTSSAKRNSQRNGPSQRRSVSIDDDDNASNNSLSSFNILLAAASDTESQSPVSVRDMIKRYDTVAKLGTKGGVRGLQQQQYSLPAMKSAYFGVNKFGTHTSAHRYSTRHYATQRPEEDKGRQSTQTNHNNDNRRNKNKSNSKLNENGDFEKKERAVEMEEDSCLVRSRHISLSEGENVYVADHTRRTSSSPARSLPEVSRSFQETNCSEATDVVEEANLQPMETSYQSKTTIAKTAAGVRIIIDIFFDQEHQPLSPTDVVGSRVETDIPQSRILSEFQQQTANSQLN
uniref:Uncharacterized protein n=1 Tax=Ceratitis capitata TaxID=7213 RepID=W8B0K9_CERCA